MVMFMANCRRCHLPRGAAVTTYCQPYAHILCARWNGIHPPTFRQNQFKKFAHMRGNEALTLFRKSDISQCVPVVEFGSRSPGGEKWPPPPPTLVSRFSAQKIRDSPLVFFYGCTPDCVYLLFLGGKRCCCLNQGMGVSHVAAEGEGNLLATEL